MSPRDGRLTVLVAPDKFKGSLTAAEAAHWITRGLTDNGNQEFLSCEMLPLADGGDGSVDAALAAGFAPITLTVSGPTGHRVVTTAALDGSLAMVEVATTSGLAVLHEGRREALDASSYGVGEAIRHVVTLGAHRIVVALGGSASTDGGAGMLAALGARFRTADGTEIVPNGGNLATITTIDLTGLLDLNSVELVGASDVTNPLTGIEGAAQVFGPQKGADPSAVVLLDDGLAHLVGLAEAAGFDAARALSTAPGAGSAGGIGYAVLLLGGRLVSGADFFLDLLDFDRRAAATDLVITGEGSLDEQTRHGKLVSVVAQRAGSRPVIAVVGRSTLSATDIDALGLDSAYAITERTEHDSSRDAVLSARLLADIGRDIADGLSPTLAGLGTRRQTQDR